MSTLTRDGSGVIRSAVRITENVCALPAVATQDWCDQAAAALLPLCPPAIAAVFIGQIDPTGSIVRRDATGAAGCYVAEVATTLGGGARSAVSVLAIEPSDASLTRVRTNLDQARHLSWAPGDLVGSGARAGTPEYFGLPADYGSTPLGQRWDSVRSAGMLLGVVALGRDIRPAGRALVVEIAHTGGLRSDLGPHADALLAVLPALARRANMAIGQDQTDSTQWITSREQVILRHLLLGKSVREIADELGRSPHTVHDHVKSLHRKLNASSRGELVARALGHVEPKPMLNDDHAPARQAAPSIN
ncbi:MAG: response regulator transcription factor [Phycisphaeraceae bacterium]|nr:response regulator transcription factor [Phycisphaeraceae bacterium]